MKLMGNVNGAMRIRHKVKEEKNNKKADLNEKKQKKKEKEQIIS